MNRVSTGERYASHFKEKVLEFVLGSSDEQDAGGKTRANSISAASEKFNVHPDTVSNWLWDIKAEAKFEDIRECQEDALKHKEAGCCGEETFQERLINCLKEFRLNCLNDGKKVDRTQWKGTIKEMTSIYTSHEEKKKDCQCQLVDWCDRLLKETSGGSSSVIRVKYTDALRDEVCLIADIIGQRSASRLLSVPQKRVNDWMLKKHANTEKISCLSTAQTSSRCKSQKFLEKSKKQVKCLKAEDEIFQWFKSIRPRPSSSQIRKKAQEIYSNNGFPKMECSYGWYRRWRKRFGQDETPCQKIDKQVLVWILEQYDDNRMLRYQEIQNYAQYLAQLEGLVLEASDGWVSRFLRRNRVAINFTGFYNLPDFPSKLEHRRQEFLLNIHLPAINVFAMDEIPLSFSPMRTEQRKSRIQKISLQNGDATLILCITSHGSVLNPFVILKDGQSPRLVRQPERNGPIVYYSDTTEPSFQVLQSWVENVLQPNLEKHQAGIILLDGYKVHETLKSNYSAMINWMIFPLGTSLRLQPINVTAKRIVQEQIEKKLDTYIREQKILPQTSAPSTKDIIEWIDAAVHELKRHEVSIMQSFDVILK